MKVKYQVKEAVDIKKIKEELKPFGGRCAKFVNEELEYQIQEDNKDAAYGHLKEKGYVE